MEKYREVLEVLGRQGCVQTKHTGMTRYRQIPEKEIAGSPLRYYKFRYDGKIYGFWGYFFRGHFMLG